MRQMRSLSPPLPDLSCQEGRGRVTARPNRLDTRSRRRQSRAIRQALVTPEELLGVPGLRGLLPLPGRVRLPYGRRPTVAEAAIGFLEAVDGENPAAAPEQRRRGKRCRCSFRTLSIHGTWSPGRRLGSAARLTPARLPSSSDAAQPANAGGIGPNGRPSIDAGSGTFPRLRCKNSAARVAGGHLSRSRSARLQHQDPRRARLLWSHAPPQRFPF